MNLFAIEHESFATDLLVNRFFTQEQEITINPETNPDQQAFIDFQFDTLRNSKFSINYDDDYTFLSGDISLELAKSIFGYNVRDTSQTQYVLAYIVKSKLDKSVIDFFNLDFNFEFIVEAVKDVMTGKYKTAYDIKKLIEDVVELINRQKNNQLLDTIG